MKILVDMNLSPEWVGFFKQQGVEARHWSETGAPTAPDREIFEWAQFHDYVVFTHDLDFGAILAASGANAPSVIQVRTQDVLPERIGATIVTALREHAGALESGALLSVDGWRSRVRILPLNR